MGWRGSLMNVKEFMTTNIESIDHKRSVYFAIERMVNRRIRCLMVRFPGKEREYGVITARDVVFKVLAKGIDPKKINVSKIASKPIVCISQDTDFKEVAKIMNESNIARAFICDQDRVTGRSVREQVAGIQLFRVNIGDYRMGEPDRFEYPVAFIRAFRFEQHWKKRDGDDQERDSEGFSHYSPPFLNVGFD